MIGETIVTAPRISTDIAVDTKQPNRSIQDVNSEIISLEKQLEDLQKRRQNLIDQSQRGLGRFAPQSLFSFSDPNFQEGKQMFIKDFDDLINPLLERIENLKKLRTTKMDDAGISAAPVIPQTGVTQQDIDQLKTTKTEVEEDDTTDVVPASGEDTQGDNTGEEVPDGTTIDIEDKEPLFQTERMLNFLRNVIKAGQKAQPSGSLIKQYQDDYLTNYSQFKKTETTLDWLNQVKTLINDPGDVTGLFSYARSLGYQYFQAPFNAAATPDKLTIIKRILTTISTSNPGDIINQSSGRLSDRDIQLAKDILGALEGFKAITTCEPELLSVINRQLIRFGEGQDERLAIINNANEFFKNNNLNPPTVPEFTAKQGSKTSTGQEVIEYNLGSLEAQNEITNKNIADKTRSEALKSAGVDD